MAWLSMADQFESKDEHCNVWVQTAASDYANRREGRELLLQQPNGRGLQATEKRTIEHADEPEEFP